MPERIRILIVDDEPLARQRILRFLKNRGESFEIREAENGIDAKELVSSFRPAIVLLDVEMPLLDGFQFLSNFEKRDFKVIFQTAFDQFAIRAFDEAACDYLLKPFDQERFDRALDRALSALKRGDSWEALERNRLQERKFLDRLLIKQGQKTRVIRAEEILYFKSQDHYTFAYLAEEELICDLSLNHLERRLDPREFVRIHRNTLVALKAIKTLIEGEHALVELNSGARLVVSRRKKTDLFALISKSSLS